MQDDRYEKYIGDPTEVINGWYRRQLQAMATDDTEYRFCPESKRPSEIIGEYLYPEEDFVGDCIVIHYDDGVTDVLLESYELDLESHINAANEFPAFRRKVRFFPDGSTELLDSLRIFAFNNGPITYEIRRYVQFDSRNEPKCSEFDLIVFEIDDVDEEDMREDFRPRFSRRYWIDRGRMVGVLYIYNQDCGDWIKVPGEFPPSEDVSKTVNWLTKYGVNLDLIDFDPDELRDLIR